MPYTCPTCKRPFKHANQWHSCVTVNVDDHFTGKEPTIRAMYDALMKHVLKFGEVNVSPSKGSIMITREGTFLAVKTKRDSLDIEFLFDRELEDVRIHKKLWLSKSRCAHCVRLYTNKDIDTQLIKWLRESHSLSKK